MAIDGNDVCTFVTTCRQPAWLHNMIAVAQQRLEDLRAPGATCPRCMGKKVIIKNFGGNNQEEIPCPICVPVIHGEDPKVVAKLEERVNALQEGVIAKNAEIEALKAENAALKAKPIPVAPPAQGILREASPMHPVDEKLLKGAISCVPNVIAKDERIVIAGGPRTGKTTKANEMAEASKVTVKHTDDLIGEHEWSEASQKVADFFAEPGPWIVEGVATVRALRKWLKQNPEGKPCDKVIKMITPLVPLTPGQITMEKGCATVFNEIEAELRARGVDVVKEHGSTKLTQPIVDREEYQRSRTPEEILPAKEPVPGVLSAI